MSKRSDGLSQAERIIAKFLIGNPPETVIPLKTIARRFPQFSLDQLSEAALALRRKAENVHGDGRSVWLSEPPAASAACGLSAVIDAWTARLQKT